MTQSPPPESTSQVRSRSAARVNDEWIAVLVSLLALGSIFFWIFGRTERWSFSSSGSVNQLVSQPIGADSLSLSRNLDNSFSPLSSSRPKTTRPEPLSRSSLDVQASNPLSDRASTTGAVVSSAVIPGAKDSSVGKPEVVKTQISPSPAATPTESPQAAPSPPLKSSLVKYPDVAENYWAEEFIESATEQNLMGIFADGSFKPEQMVTRGELATQIENTFEPPREEVSIAFKDVPSGYEGAQAIQEATRTGFMKGYPGEVFQPEQPVPRMQVLVALVSGLELEPPKNPEAILRGYKDADQIPKWAMEKIAAATQAGLVVNYPEVQTLNPNQPATRAEVAVMLHQARVKAGKAQPIASDYIVPPKQDGGFPF
ncbi:MAG: S-layer homology domain-containing protein [Microcoleaceae cyanobacterium]